MTPRCQICGTFESENTSILAGYDICTDCLTSLIDNHAEHPRLLSENRRLNQLLTDIKDNAEIAAVSFSERLP